jgi:small subunit ribosomal protein S4
LKGTRCDSPKCAIERRNIAPGMHGHRRGKLSDYGVRLRAKQKLKRFYGVLERQFRRYFAIASRSPQNTGEALLSIMERRLDNVIYRLGFASSRAAARQLVSHGHVMLNGKACDIPSMLVNAGDTVKVKPRERTVKMVKANLQSAPVPVPDHLELITQDPPEGRVLRIPTRADVDPHVQETVQEQLIIEFCSR